MLEVDWDRVVKGTTILELLLGVFLELFVKDASSGARNRTPSTARPERMSGLQPARLQKAPATATFTSAKRVCCIR